MIFDIYKLTDPPNQVGMPSKFKWAVSRNNDFDTSFTTRRDARAYLVKHGACTLCGDTERPCVCEGKRAG